MKRFHQQDYFPTFQSYYKSLIFSKAAFAVLTLTIVCMVLIFFIFALANEFPSADEFWTLFWSNKNFVLLFFAFPATTIFYPILRYFYAKCGWVSSITFHDMYLLYERDAVLWLSNKEVKLNYHDIKFVRIIGGTNTIAIEGTQPYKNLSKAFGIDLPNKKDKYDFLCEMKQKLPGVEEVLMLTSPWPVYPKAVGVEDFKD